MSKRNVNDYITEGIHGVRLPKEGERIRFLGTLRERVVIALTIGQVMSDSGLQKLDEAMQQHPGTKLIMNGHVAHRFLTEEKALAAKHNISYTTITNEENDTDIGAVLTYDYAINKEEIFIKEEEPEEEKQDEEKEETLLSKIKNWFR
ncbi:YueI family protein [Oceanobacillus alkalisoli]|uniref:YueI family protein n=1 Tax=Oceanobacillus alkalisoli TaxID=2925113 RepID=UPI001EF09D6D|nr:YueI family protein [Oceanobacillus alkalisoli]MCF3944799.1 YueI family protein [Oceanobacillus alkalisoli]MCG5105311.1 YueI family protein [Oceanobacillus alkalisoli]